MTSGEKARVALELHKIEREINTHGTEYEIMRNILDSRGERTEKIEKVISINGIFHISGGYVSRETTLATDKRSVRQPMLLCLWKDIEKVRNRDFFILNDQNFSIVNKRNINEQNIVCDLSLEVVLDGFN